MGNKEDVINHPKPFIKRLFCRHKYEWYRAQANFFNLSGETQYCVCSKCGRRNGTRFVPNFDGS